MKEFSLNDDVLFRKKATTLERGVCASFRIFFGGLFSDFFEVFLFFGLF
jgi:hypothetical protein